MTILILILFGRVWIMGSSFPRIELIRLSRMILIAKILRSKDITLPMHAT